MHVHGNHSTTMRTTRSSIKHIGQNGQKEDDQIFVTDKSENDSDTEPSQTQPDYENSESETENDQDIGEIMDTVNNLKAQIAEQTKTVRDSVRNVHTAMAQMKEYLREQQDWIADQIGVLKPPKRSRFYTFMRVTGVLGCGILLGILAVAVAVAWNVHNETVRD